MAAIMMAGVVIGDIAATTDAGTIIVAGTIGAVGIDVAMAIVPTIAIASVAGPNGAMIAGVIAMSAFAAAADPLVPRSALIRRVAAQCHRLTAQGRKG